MPARARIDVALARLGHCPSREKAKAAIAAGLVFVNGVACTKASATVTPADRIEVRGAAIPYVGRGGLKLEKALRLWDIDVAGLRCVDAGASTGGFTDCLLQRGAAHVTAIDVGHDQLAPTLAADPRVTSLEGTDIRAVDAASIGGGVDFLGTDVSFISLGKVLPALAGLLRDGGRAVCLVKPQFEAGAHGVGKRGVVRDPAVHRDVLSAVIRQAREAGFDVLDVSHSPVRGSEGNIEYLLYLRKDGVDKDGERIAAAAAAGTDAGDMTDLVARTVAAAHAELGA